MPVYEFKVKMNYKSRSGKDVIRTLVEEGADIEAAYVALKNSYCGKDIDGNYIDGKKMVKAGNHFSFSSLGGETQDNIDYECDANNCDSIIETGALGQKTVYHRSK